MPIELIEQTIDAHGGSELWQHASEVRVHMSSGGLAFSSKLQGRAVRDVVATVSTHGQHVTFAPYPAPGQRGVLEHDGTVRIETDTGEILQQRVNAREAFGDLRHKLWWDRLDILYFGAYAMWTYVSTPFVFSRDGYQVRELDRWSENGESWRRLAVTFPPDVQTHCREQVFHLDERGLIRRHDYTAEPIGGWARAAHYCFDHRTFDGLVMPVRRRVYPRKRSGRRRVRPLLVWVDVSHASVGP